MFNINDLSKSASIFSYQKLDYFNNYYLRQEQNLKLFINYCKSNINLEKCLEMDERKLIRIFNIYKKDISKYEEIVNIAEIYFNSNFEILKNEIFKQEFNNCFNNFLELINSIKNWEYDVINSEI